MSDKVFMMGMDKESDPEVKAFADLLNDLLESGKVRMEVGNDGTPRFYPVD